MLLTPKFTLEDLPSSHLYDDMNSVRFTMSPITVPGCR